MVRLGKPKTQSQSSQQTAWTDSDIVLPFNEPSDDNGLNENEQKETTFVISPKSIRSDSSKTSKEKSTFVKKSHSRPTTHEDNLSSRSISSVNTISSRQLLEEISLDKETSPHREIIPPVNIKKKSAKTSSTPSLLEKELQRSSPDIQRPKTTPRRLKPIVKKTLNRRIIEEPSTFEKLIRKEETLELKQLNIKEKLRTKWQRSAHKLKESYTAEDAFDFFTRVWDEDIAPEEALEATSYESLKVLDPSSSAEIIGEEDEGQRPTSAPTRLATADYLGIVDDDEWANFIHHEPLNVRPTLEQLNKAEEELLFYPSMQRISLEDRLPGESLRFAEEEGLFVGKRPHISRRNRNRIERRLISECSEGKCKWFGDDGELIALPFPARSIPLQHRFDLPLPNQLQTEFFPAKSNEIDISSENKYILEVELQNITFTHHSLFSPEHVLAQKLSEYYSQHIRCKEMTQNAERRLDALIKARNALRHSIEIAASDGMAASDEQERRLIKFQNEIKDARINWLKNGKSDRQTLTNLLTTWRDLKQLRQRQEYNNTSVRLHIHRMEETSEESKSRWDAIVSRDVEERERELMQIYNRRLEAYKKRIAQWNAKRIQHEKQIASNEDSPESEHGSGDFSPPSRPEPEPPAKPELALIRTEAAEELAASIRPVGEPLLFIELVHTEPISIEVSDSLEKQRRQAVKRCRITLLLLFNGHLVSKAEHSQMDSTSFQVYLNLRFPIQIFQWPMSLQVRLYEERVHLADVFLTIPSNHSTFESASYDQHEFSSNRVVNYDHAGVGSGTFQSEGSSCLYTTGQLTYRAGWNEDSNGHLLAPPQLEIPFTSRREETILPALDEDIFKLKEWAKKAHIDPNDPHNAIFFKNIKAAEEGLIEGKDVFRLDPLQMSFDFCSLSDLDNDRRLKLLQLRNRGEPEFRGVHLVPAFSRDIPDNIFEAYEQRTKTSKQQSTIIKTQDPIDSHRKWGLEFLRDARSKVLQRCRQAQQHRRYQDVIVEEQVPDIRTLGLTFLKWLQPKRPLRPERKERKKVTVQNLAGQEVKLVVHVIRAFDVPIRKDVDPIVLTLGTQTIGSHQASGMSQKLSLVPVRPFIQIAFQGVHARTSAAEGANPTWNQELTLPIRTQSTGSLGSIQDILYLHLFDEVVVDLLQDETLRETNIHQRLEYNWLGSLQIPFNTLYFNSRIEGTFKLYSPPLALGYEREPQNRQFVGLPQNSEASLIGSMEIQRDATYLTLFVTVLPALNPPEPFKEKLESHELEVVEQHLTQWEKNLSNTWPNRKIKTLVIDISGKSVCVTRFIKPLEPPVIEEGNEVTPEMVARYVSMIPSNSNAVLFPGLFDIWLTGEQILRLLCASIEDQAVLLTCFLLHLKLKSWLVLGIGVPQGPTAYVLTRDISNTNLFYIWEPATGFKYNVRDPFCPLQKVFCLINDENIWVNIQKEENPRNIGWIVSRAGDWQAAFGRACATPNGSVQPAQLKYSAPSMSIADTLRDRIDHELKDNIMLWRASTRTIWNRYCIKILAQLLPTLERRTWRTQEVPSQELVDQLQNILSSHKMCGFPINLPYTTMEAIMDAVKATGLHFNQNPDVEFALAVYVHPYPGNIFSVWIYVASLVQRR